MEETLDNFLQTLEEIIKVLGPLLLASLPGIISLIQQNKKSKAEIKKIDIEATEKLTLAAGNVQDLYQGMFDDMKDQMVGCKTKLDFVLIEMELVRRENSELKNTVSLLEKRISALVRQLKEKGIDPLLE
jgi:uncharacterized pyridoxamine 5'-phosphate oxidase family protein